MTAPWGGHGGHFPHIYFLAPQFAPKIISNMLKSAKIWPGGGVTLAKIVHGCACRKSKTWLSLYHFFAQLPTHQYTIFDRKHPILPKLGAFYNNLLKIHPIFEFGLLLLWRKPPDRYTKFGEKAPQKAGTFTYTMSMWEPHPREFDNFSIKIAIFCTLRSDFLLFSPLKYVLAPPPRNCDAGATTECNKIKSKN